MIEIEREGITIYGEDWKGIAALFHKLATATKASGAIKETGQNQQDRYKFANADDILAPVRKALSEANLGQAMAVVSVEQTLGTTKSGADRVRTTMKSQFIVGDGETGAFLVMPWVSEAADSGLADKGVNKCTTSAQKFFLKKLLLLTTQEDIDEDADNDSTEEGQQSRRAQTTTQRTTTRKPEPEDSGTKVLDSLVGTLNTAYNQKYTVDDVLKALGEAGKGTDDATLKTLAADWYDYDAITKLAAGRPVVPADILTIVHDKVGARTLKNLADRYAAIQAAVKGE